jgi:4-amino-4-deoxy-L-arabinose transferase-like glycosyltransferase
MAVPQGVVMPEIFESLFRTILCTGILVFLAHLVLLAFTGLMIRKTIQEKSSHWPLLLILLLGLGLRIFWIQLIQPVPQSDFQVYWQAANNIYQGDLSFTFLDRHAGTILAYVNAFLMFGNSMVVGWGVNLLFSLMMLLAVYRLSVELFNRPVALAATALAAIFPQFVTYSALMATEIHAIAFTLVILWSVLYSRDLKRHRLLYWVVLGLLIYGGVMVRASNLLLLAAVPVVLIFTRRDALRQTLAGCAVMVITAGLLTATWVYHQFLITGVPKLFFTEYSLAFASQYGGDGGVTGLSSLPYYEKAHAQMDGTIQGELRARKVIEAEALKIIRQDPLQYLRFGVTRLYNSLWFARTGIVWSINASPTFHPDPKFIRRFSEISTHIWRVLLVLSLLGLSGLIRPLRRSSLEGLLIMGLYTVIWMLCNLLLATGTDRYALQIAPLAIICAAGGVQTVLDVLKPRSQKSLKPARTA